jgi:ferritin
MALIKQNIIDLLQLRIENEAQSSRIYKAMSCWLDLNGYTNAAKLWQKYSDEELVHAEFAVQYLLDLNILPITPVQDEPKTEFKGLPQIIQLSYDHEIEITAQCNELARTCLKESDMMTFGLAQKYVAEQVEELAKTQLLLDQISSFGEDKVALRLLDNYIGENLL